MSIKSKAKREMELVGVDEEDQEVMMKILTLFFDKWDSGGSVWIASDMLNRLICGKCLSPLTGKDDEWMEVGEGLLQNKRIYSVFKDNNLGFVYDLDHPNGISYQITFPYYPKEAKVASPVIKF